MNAIATMVTFFMEVSIEVDCQWCGQDEKGLPGSFLASNLILMEYRAGALKLSLAHSLTRYPKVAVIDGCFRTELLSKMTKRAGIFAKMMIVRW